ncbi:MAG: hypothetical protein RBU37_03225 [Myxococcota bacterium]|jgi:hypothetical protein|nr:hypothetical protein [Myxococcota bacterium]
MRRALRLGLLLWVLWPAAAAVADEGWDSEDDDKGDLVTPVGGNEAVPISEMQNTISGVPEADEHRYAAAFLQAHVGGWMGQNVGLSVAFSLQFLGRHAVELVGFVGGGTHLRTGPALRYRFAASDALAFFVSAGVCFDFLFASDELSVWSYTSTLGLGLELALSGPLYLAVDMAFALRVSPLSMTTVLRGDDTRELRYDTDEIPFDLAFGLLRPGLALGLRL